MARLPGLSTCEKSKIIVFRSASIMCSIASMQVMASTDPSAMPVQQSQTWSAFSHPLQPEKRLLAAPTDFAVGSHDASSPAQQMVDEKSGATAVAQHASPSQINGMTQIVNDLGVDQVDEALIRWAGLARPLIPMRHQVQCRLK